MAGQQAPVRRRRRPAKSCEQCRSRKVRCDQRTPCGPCLRTRAPLQCSYRDESSGASSADPAPSAVLSQSVCSDDSSGFLSGSGFGPGSPAGSFPGPHGERISQERHHVESLARPSLQNKSSSQQERTIQELRQQVLRLQQQLASTKQAAQVPTRPSTTAAPGDRSTKSAEPSVGAKTALDSYIPVTTPKLRNAPDKTKLFGQSHWVHTAEKFEVLGRFDEMEVEPSFTATQAELANITKETRRLRKTIKAQESVQLNNPVPDLLETLPSKATCDELVQAYLRTFEPIYRILHVPTFWKEYAQFWESPGSQSSPTHFHMKMVLVLAIGTTFLPKPSPALHFSALQQQAQRWIYAAQWWLTGPSEKSTATMQGLQVFCLLILARQTVDKSPGRSTWVSTGSLIAMALSMGLHRDPKIFPSLPPFQVQMRARLWTTVLELVCRSSLDSHLPPGISADDFDGYIPSNYNDRDLDYAKPVENPPSNEITDSSAQILLAKSLPLRLRAARLLNNFRNDQSYQAALELGVELRTACREVAAFFHSARSRSSDQGTGRAVLPLTDFQQKLMDIYLRTYILLLHRPFMLQSRKDPRFYLARKICVESAMVIASYANGMDLNPATGPSDDFARLSTVSRGVLKGPLSLDVTMVLSLELVTQLEEEGPGPFAPDPLDRINKASRAPLVQILEHIKDQLLQVLARGSASTKRYLFLSAYLSQIRAMESGQNVKKATYEDTFEGVKKCHSLLQEQAAQLQHLDLEPQQDVSMSMVDDTMPSIFFEDANTTGPWDLSYLLNFPLAPYEEQSGWGLSSLDVT